MSTDATSQITKQAIAAIPRLNGLYAQRIFKTDLATIDPEGAKALAEGEKLTQDPDAHKRICAALKTGSDDVTAITGGVAATLVPMIIVGTVAIAPLIIAAVVVIIAHMGVSAYCADVAKSDK